MGKIREDVVNKCVKQLNMPQSLDSDENQKKAMCKKLGANAAEIASAMFLANYTMEMDAKQQQNAQMMQAQQQPQIVYQQQPQYQQPQQGQGQYVPVQPIQPMNGNVVYQQPMQPQQYGQQPPAYGQPQQGYVQPLQPHDTPQNPPQAQVPDEPPMGGGDGDGGLDDLEARFAALKNGL